MLVGYLFTDIESSTERWERTPQRMRLAVDKQNAIIDGLVALHGGTIHDRAGDGVFAIFDCGNPLECALAIQLAIQREDWSGVGGLELRLGVHVGEAPDGAIVDQTSVNRAARIMGSGWGGQIVVSGEAIAAYDSPAGATFVDLGICQFKGIDELFRLSGLVHPSLQKVEFPPLRSHHVQGLNIPRPSGPLFGRALETAEVVARLARVRQLTIVGPGGIGKTRLAIEVATDCARGRPVVFVSLDSVTRASEFTSALASALRYPFHGVDPPEKQLIEYLRDRSLLLVLDNADEMAGRATIVAELLSACPQLTILTTSREGLRLAGEVLYRLSGLALVGEDINESPAYQMFAFEAHAQGVDLAFENETQRFQKICELVGGSPLALRLVARWSRLLSLREVLEQLRNGSGLLVGAGESNPENTLQGVFEGSWRLLSSSQQDALARLSVFVGAFDWEAAERVAELGLATYGALADKSLLDEETGRKFKIHPLIRDYARQKLKLIAGAEARALLRHADYYLDLVRSSVGECSFDTQRPVFERLQQDFPNIRAAWEYASASAHKSVRNAILPLHEFLTNRSMINDAISMFGVQPSDDSLRPLMHGALAHSLFAHGDFSACEKLALQIFAQRGEQTARALARDVFAGLAHVRGNYQLARHHYQRAVTSWARVGNEMRGSFSSNSLAFLHFSHGQEDEALKWNKRAFRLSRHAGNTLGMLLAHMLAGDLALRAGRPGAALINYEKALRLDAVRDNLNIRVAVLRRLGTLRLVMGDAMSALRQHREALDLAIDADDRREQAYALIEIGKDLRSLSQLDDARASLLEGVRLALALGVEAALVQGLITLGSLELDAGSKQHAQRIASVLANRSLGDQRKTFEVFVRDLGECTTPHHNMFSIEEILDDITDDAELGVFE